MKQKLLATACAMMPEIALVFAARQETGAIVSWNTEAAQNGAKRIVAWNAQ